MQNDSSSKSDEAERRFLHDLSNPLAIAAGLVETMLDDGRANQRLVDDQIVRLEKIIKAVGRMTTLIGDRRREIIQAAQATRS